jgi:hypothetical protein
VDLGERVVHGFGNINSRRDTGLDLRPPDTSARLDGVLSEISYYWTRDQGRIVPKAAFEYVHARTGRCRRSAASIR